jgi:hypothetical protein
VIVVDVLMCHTSSAAAGVTIATLVGIATPLSVIATAIGVTAPPSGIAILPCTVTSYLANLFVPLPRRLRIPVVIGITHPLLDGIDTISNGNVPLSDTF